MATVKKLMELIINPGEPEFVTRQNVVWRLFFPGERYLVDFASDFESEGWQQFDTDQDAHYFGVWVNRRKLLTLTYAEGDWTLVKCQSDADYCEEVRDMCECYREGQIATVINLETHVTTRLVQNRESFTAPANGVTNGDGCQATEGEAE